MLTRFRALVHFATALAETDGKDPDPAAMGVSRLSMQLEFEGLVSFLHPTVAYHPLPAPTGPLGAPGVKLSREDPTPPL